jgi:hypothetical protein
MLVVVVDIGLFAPSTTGRTLEQVATEIHPPRPRSRVRG